MLITAEQKLYLEERIIEVVDYPRAGILFRDITPLLLDSEAFQLSVNLAAQAVKNCSFDYIAGIEARGFIFGAALAQMLGKGFVPIRKANKLPRAKFAVSYELEYGEAQLEIHKDTHLKGAKILLIDDVLATGGSALAANELLALAGAEVTVGLFVIELLALGGRGKLEAQGRPVKSLLAYQG